MASTGGGQSNDEDGSALTSGGGDLSGQTQQPQPTRSFSFKVVSFLFRHVVSLRENIYLIHLKFLFPPQVLLGEGCVGKTSLVLRYVEDKFNERHISTVQVFNPTFFVV